MKDTVIYYIIFYRFLDTKTWQRTHVNPDKQYLIDFVSNIAYIDPSTITLKEIELPK
jgi:hypothetical protein